MNIGDMVIVNEVVYGDPTQYRIVAIQPKPGAEGPIYLVESDKGERIARYAGQLTKVS